MDDYPYCGTVTHFWPPRPRVFDLGQIVTNPAGLAGLGGMFQPQAGLVR